MKLNDFKRVKLAFTPTPLQRTLRLATAIGLDDLYIKRDDQTGLAVGGNKARKLEFLIADAMAQGADVVLTVGGPQSNHCRMTAAAATAYGLDCILIFGGPEVEEVQANMVLDRLLGATWTFTKEGQTRDERMEEVAAELRSKGRKPYLIPLGGSNSLGALGYVSAGLELAEQCKQAEIDPDYIFVACGSAGTQAGLILGCQQGGLSAKIIGVSVSDTKASMEEQTETLLSEMTGMLDVELKEDTHVEVLDDYVGEGYGIPTVESQEALSLAARNEGIILDPVYTGKAFSGLVQLVRQGKIKRDDTVIFVHTGGSPALFAERELYWRK